MKRSLLGRIKDRFEQVVLQNVGPAVDKTEKYVDTAVDYADRAVTRYGGYASDFSAGFGDAASMGVSALGRRVLGVDEVVDYNSTAYYAGLATETVAETSATLYGAVLRRRAAKLLSTAGRDAIERAKDRGIARAAKAIYGKNGRPAGLAGHHDIPVMGHPSMKGVPRAKTARTRYPLASLKKAENPKYIRTAEPFRRYKNTFITAEEHAARHRYLMKLDTFDVVRARTQLARPAVGVLTGEILQSRGRAPAQSPVGFGAIHTASLIDRNKHERAVRAIAESRLKPFISVDHSSGGDRWINPVKNQSRVFRSPPGRVVLPGQPTGLALINRMNEAAAWQELNERDDRWLQDVDNQFNKLGHISNVWDRMDTAIDIVNRRGGHR